MKVAIVAYGHADNVLCLSKAISKHASVSVIFVTSGNRFTASLFDWDISRLLYGITSDTDVIRGLIDERILDFIGDDIRLYIVRTPTKKILKDVRRVNLECIKAVAEFIIKEGCNVVHFNGSSGFQVYFQRYLSHIGKAYTIHDYLPHTGEATFKGKWMNVLLNRLHTKCDYEFILHYEFLSNEFCRYYKVDPGKVHTVRCGLFHIYKVFAGVSIQEEPHTLLFFGRISPYKGLQYLCAAFSHICKNVPDAKLIIAGKGQMPNCVVDENRYEIYNRYIDNDELVNLIRRAAFVVTPYTDATHSAVVMTAFAFDKPVVASNVGGIPEVVRDNITGLLVPPCDVNALANAISELLTNERKRSSIARNINARFSMGEFSWDYIAEQTMAVYDQAISRNN